MRVHAMPQDGNCLFHALAFGRVDHGLVRRGVAGQIKTHWDVYKSFVPEPERRAYLAAIRRDGTWGDELSIRAFCDLSGERVRVYDTRAQRVVGDYGDARRVAHNLLYDGAHYDVLSPQTRMS